MAVAYLDRQIVSRGAGQSVVAKSAYNSCSSLSAEDGLKDYSNKQGLAYEAILMHDNTAAPARGEFWRAIESREKRKDAQLAYSYAIALPAELNRAQQIDLTKDYARWIMDRYGLEAVDICVHHPVKRRRGADESAENPHVHLLAPTRDRDGKKIRLFNNKDDLKEVRKAWEQIANQHLAAAGVDARISMDSAATQLQRVEAEITDLKMEEEALKQEVDDVRRNIRRRTLAKADGKEDRHPRERAFNDGREAEERTASEGYIGHEHKKTNSRIEGRNNTGAWKHTASPSTVERATEPGRGAGIAADPIGYRGAKSTPDARRGQIEALGASIAGMIDGLRYQRQAERNAHPLAALGQNIAGMIDGVRYERHEQWRQRQQYDPREETQDALRL